MSDERKPMTDEELVAIKKRTDAITPGPWRVYYAHVPEDIARLLAEVERLQTKVKRLQFEKKRMRAKNERLLDEVERLDDENVWLSSRPF